LGHQAPDWIAPPAAAVRFSVCFGIATTEFRTAKSLLVPRLPLPLDVVLLLLAAELRSTFPLELVPSWVLSPISARKITPKVVMMTRKSTRISLLRSDACSGRAANG
jgi:hypothetical protein